MAPRYPLPFPHGHQGDGEVGDFGVLLNYTTAAEPYTHGLTGVNQDANYLFVNILIASFMALLLVTLGYVGAHRFNAHIRHLFTMGKVEDQRYYMNNHSRFWPKVKKNLLYAPLGRVRHNKELQLSKSVSVGTLPTRFHTILLGLYLASNVAYCLALSWTQENSASVVAELRGRTGILAAFNLIPTVLFALRNNPLIPILRVSYDTFNLLHRWCARIAILESIIHTICWAVNSVQAGGTYQLHVTISTSTSYQWGMVATCVFITMAIIAVGPVRHAAYETFLNAHRLLAMIAIAGVYVHLYKANLPQLPYIQLVLALWAAELLWRCLRIWYHNFSRKHGFTKVTVTALPGEACRVTFDLSRPWHYTPGCHVHAYLPAIALWSSHPFSIAWAENRSRSPPLEMEMAKVGSNAPSVALTQPERPSLMPRASTYSRSIAPTLGTVAEHGPEDKLPNAAIPREASVTSISLIMRARNGMTRALYEKASSAPSNTLTTWGAIEGPYGGHESMASYGTVILFAGGVGITHCVGYVHHLLTQYQAGVSSTRKILLVWSVPDTEALEWVREWMDKILKMEGRREVLRIQLFVTKPKKRTDVVSNTGSVQMFAGRCNASTILEKEMPERIGAVGVTVCGPGALSDSVRQAVRNVVTDGAIDFVEEAFSY